MTAFTDAWGAIDSFLYVGGDVLILIGLALLAMWTLIIERCIYFRYGHPRRLQAMTTVWNARTDHVSWNAHQVRRLLISETTHELFRSIATIRTLIAICPLLGLLGTVTGMMEVFEVMALLGNDNPRAMAAGVYRSTLPTMAGMVAAISALFFSVALSTYALRMAHTTNDALDEG